MDKKREERQKEPVVEMLSPAAKDEVNLSDMKPVELFSSPAESAKTAESEVQELRGRFPEDDLRPTKPSGETVKEEAVANLFESSKDFGAPDIDAMMVLSRKEAASAVKITDNIAIAPRFGSADEKGGIMDIKDGNAGKDEPVKSGLPVPEAGLGGAEPRIERSSPQEFTLKASVPAAEKPGLAIERIGSVFNTAQPAAAPGGENIKTVLPGSSVSPEEPKTAVNDSGAAQSLSAAFLALAAKPVPNGVPPERVRTIAFLYAQNDADLCAEMLTELDAVCLGSSSKPMFIKRAFVQPCAPGINGAVYMQKVADAGALGLICVGKVPQENVYELENIFTAGGVFFKHFTRETYSPSAALDVLTELILK